MIMTAAHVIHVEATGAQGGIADKAARHVPGVHEPGTRTHAPGDDLLHAGATPQARLGGDSHPNRGQITRSEAHRRNIKSQFRFH